MLKNFYANNGVGKGELQKIKQGWSVPLFKKDGLVLRLIPVLCSSPVHLQRFGIRMGG